MSSNVFFHAGPLKPVAIPQHRWSGHRLLRMAEISADGTGVDWDLPAASGCVRSVQLRELQQIVFRCDDDGRWVAQVPPRLNMDWFVTADANEEDQAPVVGRVQDMTRWYVRDEEFTGSRTLACAETVDGVRRYFEWLAEAVWVQVPQARWVSLRDTGCLDELSEDHMKQMDPAAHGALRRVHPSGDRGLLLTAAADQNGRAEAIATMALRGQVDANGGPAVSHAARVAATFDPVTAPVEHAAAWLHDVLELAEISARNLLDAGVLPVVVETVALLTRDDDLPQQEYYERILGNARALRVKSAALTANTVPWRTRLLNDATRTRLAAKHQKARDALGLSVADSSQAARADATVYRPTSSASLNDADAGPDRGLLSDDDSGYRFADRFALQQSWWLAAAIAAEHPDLIVRAQLVPGGVRLPRAAAVGVVAGRWR